MRYGVAGLAAVAVFLAASYPRGRPISERVGDYLKPGPGESSPESAAVRWLTDERMPARLVAATAGMLAGVLLAQGDLFVEGPGRSTVPLALLGGAAGWLLFGMHQSTVEQRRRRRLRFELPVVADSLALYIIAGESVATALSQFAASSNGVAAEEFRVVLSHHETGASLTEALHRGGLNTAAAEARRLFTLLAHAHDTGGRLAEALTDLSTDYRAALSRDLSAEGGRRALATYGPVLALMVPVTLLFLLYPTLAGLRSLAGDPSP